MKFRMDIRDVVAAVLVGISAVLLAISLSITRIPGDTDHAAARLERSVARRLAILESEVLRPDRYIPDDMVIYCYDADTLSSWRNTFPITNDDLTDRYMFQRLSNPRSGMRSPLMEVGDVYGFFNFGSRWYLARRIEHDGHLFIAGLEIMDTMSDSFNGANRRLRLGSKFSIRPLSFSCGSEVKVNGEPAFKVLYETMSAGLLPANAGFVWLAFAFFLSGALLFLHNRKTPLRLAVTLIGVVASHFAMHLWGHTAQNYHIIFSPALFAGGEFFCSLGAVVIFNLLILTVSYCMYITRKEIASRIVTRLGPVWSAVLSVSAALGVLAYAIFTVRSLVVNSNISLELYKLGELSFFSLLVYVSYMMMLLSVPMILKMRFQHLSLSVRLILSAVAAGVMVVSAFEAGFQKELAHTEVSANKIAVDRNIYLELQLRRVEAQIAGDIVISSLAALDNTSSIIAGRIADNYLSRISQEYDLRVYVVHDRDRDVAANEMLVEKIRDGEPIDLDSRFLFSDSGTNPRYLGQFFYYDENRGLSRMLVEVERRFGASGLRRASLTDVYSYARYKGGKLVTFFGEYAYPTVFDGHEESLKREGFVHFVYEVDEGETVVISRPRMSFFSYVIAFVFLALIEFLLMALAVPLEMSPAVVERERKAYFRNRITWVLMLSLTLTLVTMAAVSVLFVYRYNKANVTTIMSEKASSIQSMVQNALKGARSTRDLTSPEARALLETVVAGSGLELSVYRPDGCFLMSSGVSPRPDSNRSCRMDANAYENIAVYKKRIFFQKEKQDGRHLYSIYAPVFGDSGQMIAILRSPYTGSDTYNFERDAVMHSMIIMTVFLILMILARFSLVTVIDRMLKPLSQLGSRMASANLDSLETLEYDRDDEISSLVQAYNRMVVELSENSQRLAQAERDKAWSSMARQVAHEIKNPLTPMKLQLQRIMRLRQKNAPDWQDKFDEVAAVLLDHIDILTDTANEFSTFAKLYTEEPASIDLDQTLQEEISMFDNRENIEFSYFGLSGVHVMAPKPQLVRVFVNLINNAVQAVDSLPEDAALREIRVSLRNSVEDGFYDIVFEDSGPGVSEENIHKLFTPNFTTKNGGSGLGLAISRSVLERCGATISYSRSFSLNGACFTIRYPKDLSSVSA